MAQPRRKISDGERVVLGQRGKIPRIVPLDTRLRQGKVDWSRVKVLPAEALSTGSVNVASTKAELARG